MTYRSMISETLNPTLIVSPLTSIFAVLLISIPDLTNIDRPASYIFEAGILIAVLSVFVGLIFVSPIIFACGYLGLFLTERFIWAKHSLTWLGFGSLFGAILGLVIVLTSGAENSELTFTLIYFPILGAFAAIAFHWFAKIRDLG